MMSNFLLILQWLVSCWIVVDVALTATADTSATTAATASSSLNGFPPHPTFAPKMLMNVTNVAGNESTSSSEIPLESPISSSSSSSFPTSNQTIFSDVVPEWKRRLPYPLNNKTRTLQRIIVPGQQQSYHHDYQTTTTATTTVEIYLLGTAHVSIDSSRDVRLLLEAVQPDIIFLELCDQRIPMLVMDPPAPTPVNNVTTSSQTEKVGFWQRLRRRSGKSRRQSKKSIEDLNDDSKNNNNPPSRKSMYSMAATLLTNMQQDYAQSLGVELGGEFRVAYQYWNRTCQTYNATTEKRRIHLILGDRPLYLTLSRAWESLRFWGKTKLLVGLLLSSFQRPDPKELQEWMQSILLDDSGDLLSKSVAELAQHFPTLEEVIIRERDAYMACKLYQTCRHMLEQGKENQTYRIVAIVGAGHVQGICQWLTESRSEESPEQILSRLVQLKHNPMAEEDVNYLTHDIMEVNPDLLNEMLNDV
jgi:pheromone shutdown protein TraB